MGASVANIFDFTLVKWMRIIVALWSLGLDRHRAVNLNPNFAIAD